MKHSLTFSPADGSIKIAGCAVEITSSLSKAQARAAFASLKLTSMDHGNGYEWLTLHGMSLGGRPCSIALGFCGETLERVHWGVELPNAKLEKGWPTRETSEEEIAFVRNYLGEVFQRSFRTGQETFPWGVVWSTFDPKGYAASSGLRYVE
ncbi:MAG: hypothetical protein ACYC3X_23810 [Pirellulaceae bacterium]